jgi:hypothetical protein
MREPTWHKIAVLVVAVALGSAVIVTDAVAAGGHAGGGGGTMAGGRVGGGFAGGRVEHGRYGRDRGLAVPFGYYPYGYYGDYGSSSNNGCVSLDAYGCED